MNDKNIKLTPEDIISSEQVDKWFIEHLREELKNVLNESLIEHKENTQ